MTPAAIEVTLLGPPAAVLDEPPELEPSEPEPPKIEPEPPEPEPPKIEPEPPEPEPPKIEPEPPEPEPPKIEPPSTGRTARA